jgi:uncharacterized protein YfiM (DUF2279 family)
VVVEAELTAHGGDVGECPVFNGGFLWPNLRAAQTSRLAGAWSAPGSGDHGGVPEALAEKYGIATQTCYDIRWRRKGEIAAILADWSNEFSDLWAAQKHARVADLVYLADQIQERMNELIEDAERATETLRSVDPTAGPVRVPLRDWRGLTRDKAKLLDQIMNEMGQNPQHLPALAEHRREVLGLASGLPAKTYPIDVRVEVAQLVWLATAARMAARSWLAASVRAGSVRLAGVVSCAQRRAERLHASWAFSSAGVSLSITPASISPRRAAASLTTNVVVAMSACSRATRTRSAGSGWLARLRWVWISQAASAASSPCAIRGSPSQHRCLSK